MAADRTCPECGVTFTPAHHSRSFCCSEHQVAFHRLMSVRGSLLMPIALSTREPSRVKGSTGDLQTWARRQMTALLDTWAREDRAAGRRPELLAQVKMDAGWIPDDTLRAKRKPGPKRLTPPSI